MKFSLLPIGNQFEYQGGTYIKISPLIASLEKTGGQRMIARAANITPLGAGSSGDAPVVSPLDEIRVLAAVQTYHEYCFAVVEDVIETMAPIEARALRTKLEQGLKTCKRALGAARIEA